METTKPAYLTYQSQRKCKHCGIAIADQMHGITQFCSREVLPDGSIKSCKDDYHAERNRLKHLPFINIFNFHKATRDKIADLLTKKGEVVTTDQLDQFEIWLNRAAMIEMPDTQKGKYYFVEFCITQINRSQFKISTHENSFQ